MDAPGPAEILHYYKRSREALNALKAEIATSLDTGAPLPENSAFYGMTAEEFDAALRQMLAELNHEVVLMLVASFEAILQLDLKDCVSRKRRDSHGASIRKWWYKTPRKYKNWIEVDLLLDAWKREAEVHAKVIGSMKSLVLFRHWLAHGRYWADKSGFRNVDPLKAWQIGRALFDVLPGFPPLPLP